MTISAGMQWAVVFCLLGGAPARAQEPRLRPQRRTVEGPAKQDSSKREEGVVLVGAGDIAGCRNLSGAESTARLLDSIPGTIFAAGDLAYERGNDKDFRECYDKTWGRHKARTRPAVGNHEYETKGAAGYFRYWGGAAGEPGKGYYSYDLGAWHIIVLNSNCERPGLGGCAAGSPQEQWLRKDLSEHPAACILAYWHHPLFSSGWRRSHALRPEVKPFWEALYAAHAEIVIVGHEHNYERFAPQDPEGRADPQRGIREFVVGTGGRSLTWLGAGIPNSEVRHRGDFGVLKLTLYPHGYQWEFLHEADGAFHDSGSGACH